MSNDEDIMNEMIRESLKTDRMKEMITESLKTMLHQKNSEICI